jgi:hypothetical protein
MDCTIIDFLSHSPGPFRYNTDVFHLGVTTKWPHLLVVLERVNRKLHFLVEELSFWLLF